MLATSLPYFVSHPLVFLGEQVDHCRPADSDWLGVVDGREGLIGFDVIDGPTALRPEEIPALQKRPQSSWLCRGFVRLGGQAPFRNWFPSR